MTDVISNDTLVSLLRNSEDSRVPVYTQEELNVCSRRSVDVASSDDMQNYAIRNFVSDDKKVERIILEPMKNLLFDVVKYDNKVIFQERDLLIYRVAVDSVNDVPYYIRVEGFKNATVALSRYISREENGEWTENSRKTFMRKRTMDGEGFDIYLSDRLEEYREHTAVYDIQGVHGPRRILYPKFNKYIMEIHTRNGSLWSFNPFDCDIIVMVMQYHHRGHNYYAITKKNSLGILQSYHYVEDGFCYQFIGHRPYSIWGVPSGWPGERQPVEYEGPAIADSKPPKPRHTPVGEASEERRQLFAGAKLIKCNFRRNPDLLLEEGWTLDVKGYPNGDYERIFAPKDGYCINKLVDHEQAVWDSSDYCVSAGNHIITYDGYQFLRLEVVNGTGESLEHHFIKIRDSWMLINRFVWYDRKNYPLSYSLFGVDVRLSGRDLSHEELRKLNDSIAVDLDISKVVNYAWSTERSTVSGVMTRKVYTAVDGYCFKSFSEDGETFFKPSGDFVVTKAVHYKVMGMELITYLAHDTINGKHTILHFMKHVGKWVDINHYAYTETLSILLTLMHKWFDRKKEHVCNRVPTDDDLKPGLFYPDNPYSELQEALNIPQDPLIDGHRGGLMLPFSPSDGHRRRICEGEGIYLELSRYGDERYDVNAYSTVHGVNTIIYKAADGYHFKAVSDSGIPVFYKPGYSVFEVDLDETKGKEYFLQVNAFDANGKQYVFYYYKHSIPQFFQEISRNSYIKLRYRFIIRTKVDIGRCKINKRSILTLKSKHFKNVISFLPRMNVLVDTIKHDNYIIWKYDERKPEVITRIVTFVREGIRGCSITLVDEDGRETERLYLNTNPRTNEYTLFLHKGEMFSLFKNYLRNRKIGFAWNVRYLPDEINWTEIVEPGSKDYAMCQPGYKMSANGECEDDEESVEELGDDDVEEESVDEAEPDTNAGLTEEQKARRAAMAQKRKQQEHIADNMYYSEKKFTMMNVTHKGGTIWDARNTGNMCLDVRLHSSGESRFVECEIMSPDGRVDVRYYVNHFKGRGIYREVELSPFGYGI